METGRTEEAEAEQKVEERGQRRRWRRRRSSSTKHGFPGPHHACACVVKRNIKYSLLLPLDTGFILVEGESQHSAEHQAGWLAGEGTGPELEECDRDGVKTD